MAAAVKAAGSSGISVQGPAPDGGRGTARHRQGEEARWGARRPPWSRARLGGGGAAVEKTAARRGVDAAAPATGRVPAVEARRASRRSSAAAPGQRPHAPGRRPAEFGEESAMEGLPGDGESGRSRERAGGWGVATGKEKKNLCSDCHVGNPNQGWKLYLYRTVGSKPIAQSQPITIVEVQQL